MALSAENMDPMFNGEWSPSDIAVVKSLIASHNKGNYNNNTGNGDAMISNKNDIVDILHEQFPWKARREVINLYVDIVVEMIQCQEKMRTTSAMAGSVDLVNSNFGMPIEDQTMDNINVPLGPLNVVDKSARKTVEKQPPRCSSTHQPQRHTRMGRFWSTMEHRLFLRGLQKYGRGNWKDISRHFVKTRTPVQVSSHAQKYFRRLECPAARQRYSINDVGLYDAEPWAAATNSSNWEALAFIGGGYKSNNHTTYSLHSSQHTIVNNLPQVWSSFPYHANDEARTTQTTMTGDQQMEYSTTDTPAMVGTRNIVLVDQQETSAAQNYMINMY